MILTYDFKLMQLAEMEAKLPPQSVIAPPKPFGIQEIEIEPSAPEDDLPEPPPYEDLNENENSDQEVDAF